ncbi:MAG: flagellar assembly protein FliH [Giesbergeria sp.]
MTKPSSRSSAYSRFIPSEELGDVAQWQFGAVGADETIASQDEPAELSLEEDEATKQAAVQQALDDAFARGQEHGNAEATLDWQRKMDDYVAGQGAAVAQQLAALAKAFEQGLSAAQQQVAQGVLEVACEIARQVVRRELRVDTTALQPVIAEALGTLVTDGRPMVVRLHPGDAQALGAALKAEFSELAIQWVADPELAPGDCMVEQAGTVIDGRLERRWQRAVAPLGLDVPWESEGDHASA